MRASPLASSSGRNSRLRARKRLEQKAKKAAAAAADASRPPVNRRALIAYHLSRPDDEFRRRYRLSKHCEGCPKSTPPREDTYLRRRAPIPQAATTRMYISSASTSAKTTAAPRSISRSSSLPGRKAELCEGCKMASSQPLFPRPPSSRAPPPPLTTPLAGLH